MNEKIATILFAFTVASIFIAIGKLLGAHARMKKDLQNTQTRINLLDKKYIRSELCDARMTPLEDKLDEVHRDLKSDIKELRDIVVRRAHHV